MKIIGQNFFSLISSGQLPANGEAIDRTGSVNYGARELGKEFDFFTALDNSPLDTNPEIGKVSAYVRPSKTNPRLELSRRLSDDRS